MKIIRMEQRGEKEEVEEEKKGKVNRRADIRPTCATRIINQRRFAG